MFIKNDSSGEHRYYNGMLGEITDISDNTVTVRPNDSTEEIEVGMETWQNSRFTLNEKTNEIEEVVDGTYKQIPLRLAWAITVQEWFSPARFRRRSSSASAAVWGKSFRRRCFARGSSR